MVHYLVDMVHSWVSRGLATGRRTRYVLGFLTILPLVDEKSVECRAENETEFIIKTDDLVAI